MQTMVLMVERYIFEVKMDSIELSASSMRVGIARNTTGSNNDHIIFNGLKILKL